ncbi:unnamed protein product [Cylindrotheca closterium]|uniref:USP8 dimerisation domain-containing protein n=1 Tax=Cylindrotheca closterium TaxID=2856 RepID=A0AAD2PXB0_9STRA|nr:unnamed protein product [Cylindrotheca closterium]
METPSSARRQTLKQGADSNKIQLRNEIPLSKYYSIAKRLLDYFTASFDARSLDEAYIYGVRFVSLCVQLGQHPSYKQRSYVIQHKEMSDKCNHVLECLEIVRQRMDAQEILREQQRQFDQMKLLERQRAEEAEMRAKQKQEKDESERQEATITKMSALSKLSAMQRDLNQLTAEVYDAAQTQANDKAQSKKKTDGLIRAQVDDISPAIEESPQPTNSEMPDNSSTAAAPSLMGSAMSRMTSMMMTSRKEPKSKDDETSSMSETNKKLVPAQIADAPVATPSSSSSSKTIQSVKPVKSKVKKQQQQPKEVEKATNNALPEAKQKPATVSSSSTSKKNTAPPLQVAKLVAKPKSKQPKQVSSSSKAKAPVSKKKEIKPQATKPKDATSTQVPNKTKVSAPRLDKVEQPSKRIPDKAPKKEEPSAMETDNETEGITSLHQAEIQEEELPVQRQPRRPEKDTIDLLEASIKAQIERIEEIEQMLIPKLLEEARKEHQIAKNPKIKANKEERILHKRKAIHCLSQKRKWEKLAETTKIAVFHMETQVFRLENAMEDQQVEEAMTEAKSAMTSMGNSVGVNDLEGFSEALGAGDLVEKATVDGEDDEIMTEELESWITGSSLDGSSDEKQTDQEDHALDDDDFSILSLPNIPQQDPSSSFQSNKAKDRISKKLVQAAM